MSTLSRPLIVIMLCWCIIDDDTIYGDWDCEMFIKIISNWSSRRTELSFVEFSPGAEQFEKAISQLFD